jgi:hypothetical protein
LAQDIGTVPLHYYTVIPCTGRTRKEVAVELTKPLVSLVTLNASAHWLKAESPMRTGGDKTENCVSHLVAWSSPTALFDRRLEACSGLSKPATGSAATRRIAADCNACIESDIENVAAFQHPLSGI